MKVYGAVPPAPVKVMAGEAAFWQTAVDPEIVAAGSGFTTTVTESPILTGGESPNTAIKV
jgi:hypothetical protein